MKKIHITFIISSLLGAILFAGCESQPLTPREKQIYENEKAELGYENQQQLEDVEYEQGYVPTGDPQIDP